MRNLVFNKSLRILLATNVMILVAAAMLAPIYAIFVEEIGGDLLDASIAGSIFAFVAGFTSFLSGEYVDKLKEKRYLIVVGYLLMALGFFLYLFVHSVWMLFVVQVVIGLGEAIYSPAFDALYSKHLDKLKEGLEWGAWESLNYFSLGVGALSGGFIVNFLGFQFLFIIMGVLCLSSALYILFLNKKVL